MKPTPVEGPPLVQATLDVLGGKWTLYVLWHLRDRPKRYGQLKRLMPKISEKILIERLRELEENKIVARTTLSEKPLMVEYCFTDYGKTLIPVFHTLCDWGEIHLERMGEAN